PLNFVYVAPAETHLPTARDIKLAHCHRRDNITHTKAFSGLSVSCIPGSNINLEGIQKRYNVGCSNFRCLLMSNVQVILTSPIRSMSLALRLLFGISSKGFACGAFTQDAILGIRPALSAKAGMVNFPSYSSSSLFFARLFAI